MATNILAGRLVSPGAGRKVLQMKEPDTYLVWQKEQKMSHSATGWTNCIERDYCRTMDQDSDSSGHTCMVPQKTWAIGLPTHPDVVGSRLFWEVSPPDRERHAGSHHCTLTTVDDAEHTMVECTALRKSAGSLQQLLDHWIPIVW